MIVLMWAFCPEWRSLEIFPITIKALLLITDSAIYHDNGFKSLFWCVYCWFMDSVQKNNYFFFKSEQQTPLVYMFIRGYAIRLQDNNSFSQIYSLSVFMHINCKLLNKLKQRQFDDESFPLRSLVFYLIDTIQLNKNASDNSFKW